MRGRERLAQIIKDASDSMRSNQGAVQGIIENNRVIVAGHSYPFVQAVDCPIADGSRVCVILSRERRAVIVGA